MLFLKRRPERSVIVRALRTPIGKRNGMFKGFTAYELGAEVIYDILIGAPMMPEEVIMGNMISIGHFGGSNLHVRQNPAKEAVISSGYRFLNAQTVNKACSSGLKAVMLADEMIRSGDAICVLAGGMESMSGFSGEFMYSALQDSFQRYPMYEAGDWCAINYGISREEQDNWALESYRRATAAQRALVFNEQLIGVGLGNLPRVDEIPLAPPTEEMVHSEKALYERGTITKWNASKNADGAAACILLPERLSQKYGIKPLTRIISHASVSTYGDTREFTIMPAQAIEMAVKKAGLTLDHIGLFEINAAFACVVLYACRTLNLSFESVNVFGDAISMGHPVGASGAILLVKAVYGLKFLNRRYAVIAICNALGEATAMVIENCD